MADHYETLGVPPTASADEVRTAYLRRARALHPDRQTGLSADARDRAGQAMVQVNSAWNVLKDPASRRRYDQQRQGAVAPPRPTAARSAPPNAAPPRVRRPVDGVPPAPVGTGSPSVGWALLGGAAPYVALLAIGVAIFVITAVAGGNSDVGTRIPEAPICVSIPPSGVPVSIPCSQPNDGRLVAEVVLARVCPAGDRYEVPGGTTALCLVDRS